MVEGAIGMGKQRPGNAIDARIARQRSVAQPRQFTIEAGRQVALRLAGLLLDNVEIVQKPFAGRGYRFFRLGRFRQQAEMGHQGGVIFLQTAGQRRRGFPGTPHNLRLGETAGMLFQPVQAE